MTLAMTMGMSIGVKRTLWMMLGELVGVLLVAAAAALGVAAITLQYPFIFEIVKYAGGAYLFYLGIQLWRSRGKMALPTDGTQHQQTDVPALISQGFITAIANPKGWAFFIALLPPFLEQSRPLAPQLSILLGLIVSIEFFCLLLYATGGQSLSRFLKSSGNVRLLNRIAGSLMMGVGIWLALG